MKNILRLSNPIKLLATAAILATVSVAVAQSLVGAPIALANDPDDQFFRWCNPFTKTPVSGSDCSATCGGQSCVYYWYEKNECTVGIGNCSNSTKTVKRNRQSGSCHDPVTGGSCRCQGGGTMDPDTVTYFGC